jgi:hypothetical protein
LIRGNQSPINLSWGGENMNKKALIVLAIFAFSLLLTPIVFAKPEIEKNNEKFEYFKLEFDGTLASGGQEWNSPPTGLPKVHHSRGMQSSSVSMVELTVGLETFDMTTSPYSVDYTETFDGEIFLDNEGNYVGWHMRVTDVITVYEYGTPIGTIVLKIPGVVVMDGMEASIESGSITGYGTGELKGVHISAVDLGFSGPPFIFGREGTITGWPAEITND